MEIGALKLTGNKNNQSGPEQNLTDIVPVFGNPVLDSVPGNFQRHVELQHKCEEYRNRNAGLHNLGWTKKVMIFSSIQKKFKIRKGIKNNTK